MMSSKEEGHLQILKQKFKRYFLDLSDTKVAKLKMKGNLFCLNKDILSEDLLEEFSEMKCTFTAKKILNLCH